MNWNRCHIVIGPDQNEAKVADAIRGLVGLLGLEGAIKAGFVVALRTSDGALVGAATFSKVENER